MVQKLDLNFWKEASERHYHTQLICKDCLGVGASGFNALKCSTCNGAGRIKRQLELFKD